MNAANPSRRRSGIAGFALGVVVLAILTVLTLWRQDAGPVAAVDDPAADVRAALSRLGNPAGDATRRRFAFTTGETWTVVTELESRTGAAARPPFGVAALPDGEFLTALRARAGRFRFTVEGMEDGIATVSVQPVGDLTGWRPLNGKCTLRWDTYGDLQWQDTSGLDAELREDSPRAALLDACGIMILGPFPAPRRVHDAPDGVELGAGFKSRDIMRRLEVELGTTPVQRLGGQIREVSAAPELEATLFLAHERWAVSGAHWAGRRDVTWRGRFESPSDSPHLAAGDLEIGETFDLSRGDVNRAGARTVVLVSQRVEGIKR